MPTDKDEFGRDRFIRIKGVRHRTRLVRTLQPKDGDTNASFQERMEAIAGQLEGMSRVRSVETDYEWRNGALVECMFIVEHEPYPEFIKDDPRPAGGRNGTARGGSRN